MLVDWLLHQFVQKLNVSLVDFWLPTGQVPTPDTDLTFSIGGLSSTSSYIINPGDATYLTGLVVTQWVSVSNLDVHVFVQARNDEDQTNIDPATIEIKLLNNLNSIDTETGYCTVMTPSGICWVVISIPVDWIESIVADTNNAVSVTASITPSTTVSLGSLNARYEATCSVVNNVLIFTPTYSQFSNSLTYVPVYAHTSEGVNSFSIQFVTGSLLEFDSIIQSDYFGSSAAEDTPNDFKVSGSTLNFPRQTELQLLFTLVLSVKNPGASCTDEPFSAKVLFLSDEQQQSVSVYFLFYYNLYIFICFL